MILRMSLVTALYVALTAALWLWVHGKKLVMTNGKRLLIGIVYGICAILSTHFGVVYDNMALNVRDIAPLAAGLFFDPVSGIIAGLIGGIERYIAGTYFGVGSYTRIACSVSTCLAGFLSALFRVKIFKSRKPSPFYSFFMGAVMEVFHMYVVFITHRNDMNMAFYVVDTCAIPMIIFTGIGVSVSSMVIYGLTGNLNAALRKPHEDEMPISVKFQVWLFFCTMLMFIVTFFMSYSVQTRTALQNAANTMTINTEDAKNAYDFIESASKGLYEGKNDLEEAIGRLHVGENGSIYIVDKLGSVLYGAHRGESLYKIGITELREDFEEPIYFTRNIFGVNSYCRLEKVQDKGYSILTVMPLDEVYRSRNIAAYETAFADILLFTLVFVLIYILVQKIVVNNLDRINDSLSKITKGNLNEVVDVRTSSEFASLSEDINTTVNALKGYIEQAERRMEEELEFARAIQASALPTNFKFPRTEFDIFASMDPAKEVGGDFYDFFFIDMNKLALVIADVSGKGVPAALFMMRSKTAIKGLAETGKSPSDIFEKANDTLCDGNDADMFVTAWIGIIDLTTGKMQCANAGHEYPAIKHKDGEWELLKDKHGLALAAMEGMPFAEYEIQLEEGDKIFVYTDGVPEAINEAEEQFGTDEMLRALNAAKTINMADTLPFIRKRVAGFVGEADQFDDITMLGFEFKHKTEVE